MENGVDDFELEIKQEFISEAADLLSEAEEVFLTLENSTPTEEMLNQLFRVAHNLKGTSKAVGFDQISELTHHTENLILKIQQNEIPLTSKVIDILFDFKDKVEEMLAGFKEDLDAVFDIKSVVDGLELILAGQFEDDTSKGEEIAQEEEEEAETHGMENDEQESTSQVEEISASLDQELENILSTDFESMNQEKNNIQELPQPVIAEAKTLEKKDTPAKSTTKAEDVDEDIRVKLSRINKVNDYIGELVILQTVLEQKRGIEITDELANTSISQMSKIFKELQSMAMSLRMLPLKSTFQRMQRIVRDTSKLLGKDIKLELRGEETEVDKKVVEYILDPLVHIVRNGIDHGVESPEDRNSAGKDPQGVIELFAFHEGSNLIIQITDDGKGIDPNIIRKKGIEKGIINESTQISDQEVIQLIFHPGFSTKETVSEVSGRGVGMDVVKTNIENLGGKVTLQSKLGVGSSFRIELPLTLAIVDGLIIESANHKFALPISQVNEIVQISNENFASATNGGLYYKLRGNIIPVFSLVDKLGIEKPSKNFKEGTAIVTENKDGKFAVLIENVLYKQQVVIKELGSDIKGYNGITGATILGNGKPSFIIDLKELYKDYFKLSNNTHIDIAC